jgi:hypothetical protein
MPTYLDSIQRKLVRRIQTIDSGFDRAISSRLSFSFRTERYALQEGQVSHLWQAWNLFCRDVVIFSAHGAFTRSGNQTTSPYLGLAEDVISAVAKKTSRGQGIGKLLPLGGRHLEPTWGDASVLNKICNGLGISNSSELVSGFGAISLISDLQNCRNACAHTNPETIKKIDQARVRYNSTKLGHPSDMIHWVDPATNNFAWKSWIYEIHLISNFVVK